MNMTVERCQCCDTHRITVGLRGHVYIWEVSDGADLFDDMIDKVNSCVYDFTVNDALAIAYYVGKMTGGP